MKNSLILLCACCILLLSCKSESNDWITLFDGKSLDGWEMKIAGYAPDNEINTDPVQVMNYLIHEDFRTPVKWRTDIGDPTLDLSLELLRHTLLRSKTKLVDSMVLRRCFLFEEFCNPDIEPLFPLKAT